ncbi:hypothetical protein [Dyadobacter sp. CY323]|uniref:hypothetical protein n=1 Tax=Dyadobacter sp. CY323 TaxID=2907302 RepID=UPI001F32F796|nr:hypothetical protein [Dyadobacter sp. CY323]MCE6988945.1 hypothetical protein [Dyadobacter sp. CY323]
MISFDHSPTVYWFLGYLLAGLVIVSSRLNRVPISLYLVLCMALLVFMRLPVVVYNREINPDESQMISHAITLFQDAVYWRSVDGTTIGPLDNYLLVLPKLLGFQLNYSSGRFMGLLCTAGSLLFLFFSIKNWFGANVARGLILVPLFLLAFTQEIDFVHNSSEQLPIFLLAWNTWLLSRLSTSNRNFTRNAFLIGFVAGTIPFAKLQAVPQAFVIALAAFWFCYLHFRKNNEFRPILTLIAGGLSFPFCVLIWTLSNAVFNDLIDFYILGNMVYAEGATLPQIPSQFIKILALSSDFQLFTLTIVIAILAGIYFHFKNPDKRREGMEIRFFILMLVLSSIYAITKSGNDFIHYLNFCIIPLTLLAASATARLGKWASVFPLVLLCWFVGNDAFSYAREGMLNKFNSVNARTLGESPVVTELKKYSKKGDYMTVWGWQCVYYVEAQLAQGTSENHTERSIFNHPMRETYRRKFLSDLNRTKPAFILDAVGKNSVWVQNKETQGISSYPELFQYVQMHYKLAGDFDDTRLYVRKDRLTLR